MMLASLFIPNLGDILESVFLVFCVLFKLVDIARVLVEWESSMRS